MDQQLDTLVSIVVITFNSANYVIQTLESCKSQTYKDIELIVSDDGSTDETVKLCNDWLNNNYQFFRKIKLIEADQNSGTTENCRRGLEASNGYWIKFIAGDDILFENAIESIINYALRFNENTCGIILTKELRFTQFEDINTHYLFPSDRDITHAFYKAEADLQFQFLMLGKFVSGASIYYKTNVLKENFVFNSSISFLVEDYLAAIHLTSIGYKIHFYDTPTVFYRKQNQGVTANNTNKIFPRYYTDVVRIRKHFSSLVKLPLLIDLAVKWENFVYLITMRLGNKNYFLAILVSALKKMSIGRIHTFLYNR